LSFSAEIGKVLLKFIYKHKRSQIAKAIISKKNNAQGVTTPHFRLYYGAIVVKTALYWHKNRCANQWNRMDNIEIISYSYSHLIFDKNATYIGEKTASSTNGVKKTEYPQKRMKLDPISHLV
jgi:hypothetical protein